MLALQRTDERRAKPLRSLIQMVRPPGRGEVSSTLYMKSCVKQMCLATSLSVAADFWYFFQPSLIMPACHPSGGIKRRRCRWTALAKVRCLAVLSVTLTNAAELCLQAYAMVLEACSHLDDPDRVLLPRHCHYAMVKEALHACSVPQHLL